MHSQFQEAGHLPRCQGRGVYGISRDVEVTDIGQDIKLDELNAKSKDKLLLSCLTRCSGYTCSLPRGGTSCLWVFLLSNEIRSLLQGHDKYVVTRFSVLVGLAMLISFFKPIMNFSSSWRPVFEQSLCCCSRKESARI
jgi:hypothetical protein